MIVCLLLERLFVLGLDCLEINLLGLYNLELVGVGGRGGGGGGGTAWNTEYLLHIILC